MASRETADLWWYLFKHREYLTLKTFIRIIKSPVFWQDTFFQYFNKWIGCRKRHKSVYFTDENKYYCFACQRQINKEDFLNGMATVKNIFMLKESGRL